MSRICAAALVLAPGVPRASGDEPLATGGDSAEG